MCLYSPTFVAVISCKKSISQRIISPQDFVVHQSKIWDLHPHLIVSCIKFSLHQFCFFYWLELPDKVRKGAARWNKCKTSRRLCGLRGADQWLWLGGKSLQTEFWQCFCFSFPYTWVLEMWYYIAQPKSQRSCCLLQKYTSSSDSLGNPEEIPKEVLGLECPYPALKESLIQAFHSLTERYQSRLQSLQKQLQSTDR